MTANILLIGGSLNQTTMMHRISEYLSAYSCYFTPFYADGLIGKLGKAGMLNASILGGRHRAETMSYLQDHRLPLDVGGRLHPYDMVITGTDLVVQRNVRDRRLVLVQEGITEPEGWAYELTKRLKPLRFLANTAATGLSDAYDVFCVASPGYRDLFIRKGVRREKIAVTGIPNFDHLYTFLKNDFPYRDYVLAATSPLRESFRRDERIRFILNACRIAAGRQLLFKLHPIENHTRAIREIRRYAPRALIFTSGNINPMIANCQVLITQTSTVTYVGLALGKEVHSYLDIGELRKLLPLQNGGASARNIANICVKLMQMPLKEVLSVRGRMHSQPGLVEADGV